jgi:hypothetical protein
LPEVTHKTQWKQIETLRFDWAGAGKTATLILELPLHWDDAGDFTRLRIQTPGHPEFVLTDTDGLVNFRRGNCSSPFEFCKRKDLVDSNYVLFLPVTGGRPVLFVFGYAYASSPGSLHALAVDADGAPREIFSENEFDLYDFRDVSDRGLSEIIGRKCMSQEWGNDFETYDPYSVFRVSQAEVKAVYSLSLSKLYNLKRYYGWAGPDCREDIAVVLHPPRRDMGHPDVKAIDPLHTKPNKKPPAFADG